MIKRLVFTSIIAAQFLIISAVKNVDTQKQPTFSADKRADDPPPCPDCDAGSGPPPLAVLTA